MNIEDPKTLLFPVDTSVASIVQLLKLLSANYQIVLFFPANIVPEKAKTNITRTLREISKALHPIGTSKSLTLLTETVPRLTQGQRFATYEQSMSDDNKLVLQHYLTNRAKELNCTLWWPDYLASSLSSLPISTFNSLQKKPSENGVRQYDELYEIWTEYINKVLELYPAERLEKCIAKSTQTLSRLLDSIIPIDPTFELWYRICECTRPHTDASYCPFGACTSCDEITEYIEENSVPPSIFIGATEY